MSKSDIRIKILLPFVIAIAVIIATFVTNLNRMMHDEINANTERTTKVIERSFAHEKLNDTKLLTSIIYAIQQDKELQEYWLSKDRTKLVKKTLPLFNDLNRRNRITHFYFHDVSAVNFLRIHNPEKNGDLIDRFTMKKAQETLDIASGIEIGPLGTFTLRVVIPWFIDGKLEGYVELGEEIEHITEQLHTIFDIDLFILYKKQFIVKQKYENGMKLLNRKLDWDKYKDWVLIYQTHDWVPEIISQYNDENLNELFIENHQLSHQKKQYVVKSISLNDAGNRNVAEMFVLVNNTRQLTRVQTLTFIFVGIALGIWVILFILFYITLYRVQKNLKESQKKVLNEVLKREEVQIAHVNELQEEEKKKIILRQLIKRLSNPISMKECAKIFADEAQKLFDFDAFSFDIVDESEGMLLGIYNEDTNINEEYPNEVVSKSHSLESVRYKEILKGRARIFNRNDNQGKSAFHSYGNETRLSLSLMFVPIIYKNKTIGIISVQSYTVDKYNFDNLILLESFANHAGGPIVRIQGEVRLMASEERFRDVAQSMSDWIWEVDIDGKYTYCAGQVEEILGYSPNELIGKTPFDFMVPTEIEKIAEKFNKIFTNKEDIKNLENWSYRKDKKQICMLTNGVPMLDMKGELIGYRGVDVDITKRKNAEKEFASYIKDLEESRDTIEKNAKILSQVNVKLVESEGELVALNANKDKFFSIISHDLKSPFSGILGLTEMLDEEFDDISDEEKKERIKQLLYSSNNIYELLDGLLEWARVQRDAINFEPEIIDISTIGNSVVELLKINTENKNIDFRYNLSSNETAFADPNMVTTVIRNLATNAIKFTNNGGRIKLYTEEENNYQKIILEDSGIGMSEENLRKLFRIEIHHTTIG
ncbi:MAG: PAS domain S-box protein, partial [Ignavibacteriae bacterium]|nr:PAS domain S-box protein [Ignavibacteriota bacterium]